jgi:hypothetical protein
MKKTRYQRLMEEYNSSASFTRGWAKGPNRSSQNTTRCTPMATGGQNVMGMVFAAIWILFNISTLLRGNITGFIFSYLLWGGIFAACTWIQFKYVNKMNMDSFYKNYSFFKLAVAWLPAAFSKKASNWIFN